MNSDVLAGMWKQLRGNLKQAWGELTDDDLDQIDGQRDKLVGKLQEKYGWSKVEANAKIDRFLADVDANVDRGTSSTYR